MAKLTRAQYVDFVERSYFRNVGREDFTAVTACFTNDACITIFHGDNPVRRFYRKPQQDQQPLITFYGHLWENYHVVFENFRHIVDAENECCASTFHPLLTPKPTSSHLTAGKLTLNNCNFFWFRDGRIADMIIYYANPTPDSTVGVAATPLSEFRKI